MTNKQWIYVLNADGYGQLKLTYSPSGWDEQRVSIKRSPTYFGLTRNVSTSLKFFKIQGIEDSFEYIQNIYEREGTEKEINIGIYQYYPKPTDKYLLFFSGLIDLSTYSLNIDEEGSFIEVDINESSIARKLMSRDDVKVDVGRTLSVEGIDLGVNNRITAQLHEREILLTANYIADELVPQQSSAAADVGTGSGVTIPIVLQAGNIENLQANPYGNINSETSCFFDKIEVDSLINISGNIKGTLSGNLTGNIYVEFRVYTDDSFLVYTPNIVFSYSGSFIDSEDFDIDLNFGLSIPADARVALIIFNNLDNGWIVTYDNINLEISQNELFDTTPANGYLIHETAQRICEVITDVPNVMYSDLMGRTDIGYMSDGGAALRMILSGKGVRNFPDSSPTISLKDFFQSLNSQENIGLGIEYNEAGLPIIRIDKKEHFFDGEVIATIYNVKSIKKDVAREWIYNEVEVGYQKAEYEEVNGLQEYNNKFSWSNSIRTIKNKLDLVSKIRADGYGIEFARRKQYASYPTEDTKYDNENFVVVMNKENNQYFSVKDENYDIVENIFSPETAYNLDVTPGRMLRNSGDIIRAGLWHLLDLPLSFGFAEQKEDLRSQRTGSFLITENEDIDVKTLKAPRWIPEIYSFESILTRELLAAITKKPQGIIKFSAESKERTKEFYYGWVIDVTAEPERQTATWQLLRVNLSNSEVVLIDPEGNDPNVPPPTVTDTNYGVFSGPFDFVFVNGDTVSEEVRLLEDGTNRLLEDGTNRLLES